MLEGRLFSSAQSSLPVGKKRSESIVLAKRGQLQQQSAAQKIEVQTIQQRSAQQRTEVRKIRQMSAQQKTEVRKKILGNLK